MTGFGRAVAEGDGSRVEVEVKGVNHRFLDVKLRLPPEIGSHEPDLRSRVQGVVGRGRIDVTVTLVSTRAPGYRLEVNRGLIAEYLKEMRALQREFRLKGALGVEALVTLPGALSVRPEEASAGSGALGLVERALDGALEAYDSMRTQEGARLAEALRAHLRSIEEAVEAIEAEARGLPEAYARRLRERVAVLVQERGLDDQRLAQEVALMAGRVDITEELVRLRGHVRQIRDALEGADGRVGKTLDFLMQEMNREANTISSKAESLPICQAALAIKSEVEKIREQVQNLE
jgi:uncharacterized protein (TIGR00255 family)